MARPSRPPASRCASTRRARSASRRSVRISASAAAAPCSTGTPRRYRAWKRDLVVDGAAPGRPRRRRSPTSSTPMAKAAAAPCFTPGAARTTCLRSASRAARAHHIVADRPLSGPGQEPRRRASTPPGRSPKRSIPANKPLDIQATATDAGLDIDVRGSGPLPAPLHDARSRALPQERNLARLTRHGELIAQQRAADRAHGQRNRGAAAGRLPAGDRGRRGDARAARARRLRRRRDRRRSVRRHRPVRAAARRARPRPRRRRRRSRARRAQARVPRPPPASSRSTPRRATCSGGRSWRRSSSASTPSSSIRRARAHRRRRASWRRARLRASSRCPAIRPRSPATPASSSAPAIGSLEVTPVDQFRYAAHVEIVARLEK